MKLNKCPNNKREIKKLLIKQQNNQCLYCGEYFTNNRSKTDASFEHIVPKSLGGCSSIDNLLAIHIACNGIRGNGSIVKGLKKIDKLKSKWGSDNYRLYLKSPSYYRAIFNQRFHLNEKFNERSL